MKKLLFFLLLIASTAYAVPESKVSGPDDIFGGAGCTTDCTFDNVSAGGLTANRIDAATGVFTNVSGVKGFFSTSMKAASAQVDNGAVGARLFGSANLQLLAASASGTLYLDAFGRSTAGTGVKVSPSNIANITNSSGLFNALEIAPKYAQTGTAERNTVFINATAISNGTGEKNLIKASISNTTKYRLDEDGTSHQAGGQFTAFRNLSSAAEMLTSADHTIFCLANDNEVTLTMPPVNASYSQTLMLKYTDSGSTNKCKLDGNGAEQVEGFDVYSGLDTYKEGIIVKSDGSAWWITGGI